MPLERIRDPCTLHVSPRVATILLHGERAEHELAHFAMGRVERMAAEIEHRALEGDGGAKAARIRPALQHQGTIAEGKGRADPRGAGTDHEGVSCAFAHRSGSCSGKMKVPRRAFTATPGSAATWTHTCTCGNPRKCQTRPGPSSLQLSQCGALMRPSRANARWQRSRPPWRERHC